MVFYNFDRQLLAKIETTEGTAISAAASNYIDTLTDISVEFSPVSHARELVRPGFTTVPDIFASGSIGSGAIVGTGTISFQVEASMKTETTPVTIAPQWGALLQGCGFSLVEDIKRIGAGAISGGPVLNRENLLVAASPVGQTVGTTFTGDSFIYYEDGGGISASDAVSGAVSSASFAASGSETDVGLAYVLDTAKGTGNGSSLSLYLYRAGRIWSFKGCRGTVSFQFNSTDRVIMSFTMEGVAHSIVNGSKLTNLAFGHSLPSLFNDATMKINEHGAESTAFTGANFESITLDLGNEIALRPNANAAAGYTSAIITGRAPTMSLTADSVVGGTTAAAVFDWAKFRATGASIRTEWKCGAGLDAKSLLFRAPAFQVSGQDFDDRDGIEADAVSGNLTGGLYGDSVVASTGASRYYDDRGMDNELTIVLF